MKYSRRANLLVRRTPTLSMFPIHNLKRVGDAAAELSIELRNQYLVAYHPTNLAHDGKWHKVTVRVTPPQNLPRLQVYAKAGYYAPAR